MTPAGNSLDARLRALYEGLDTSPGFDERVIARVAAEFDAAAAARVERALAEETKRYELARDRQSWSARIRRVMTLDVLGAAVLGGFAVHAIWTPLAAQAAPLIAAHATQAATALGLLLMLAPLPVLLLRQRIRIPGLA